MAATDPSLLDQPHPSTPAASSSSTSRFTTYRDILPAPSSPKDGHTTLGLPTSTIEQAIAATVRDEERGDKEKEREREKEKETEKDKEKDRTTNELPSEIDELDPTLSQNYVRRSSEEERRDVRQNRSSTPGGSIPVPSFPTPYETSNDINSPNTPKTPKAGASSSRSRAKSKSKGGGGGDQDSDGNASDDGSGAGGDMAGLMGGVGADGRSSVPPKDSEEWTRLRKNNHVGFDISLTLLLMYFFRACHADSKLSAAAVCSPRQQKEVERRRRETINEGINELKAIVPGCDKNKGQILKQAVGYIQLLKDNEASNIEKWTLEKLLSDQAMREVQEREAEVTRLLRICQEENEALRNEIEILKGAGISVVGQSSSSNGDGRYHGGNFDPALNGIDGDGDGDGGRRGGGTKDDIPVMSDSSNFKRKGGTDLDGSDYRSSEHNSLVDMPPGSKRSRMA